MLKAYIPNPYCKSSYNDRTIESSKCLNPVKYKSKLAGREMERSDTVIMSYGF